MEKKQTDKPQVRKVLYMDTSGITLMALVVTVIILLILAGITMYLFHQHIWIQ